MRKVLLYTLVLAVMIMGLAGCGSKASDDKTGTGNVQSTPDNKAGTPAAGEKTEAESTAPAGWKAVLYFSDREGMNIVRREKTITGNTGNTAEKAKRCIEELMQGADNGELVTTIPKATRVLSVVQDKDTMVVDLSEEFEKDHVGGSTGIMMTMAPLVLTLTELEGVKQVSFKVEGKVLDEFKGHISFNKPFKRSDFEQYITQ